MAKRGDKKKKPTYFVPPARKDKREKNSPSGESGGTEPVYFERKEPLPTDTKWTGNASRMPPGYSSDRKWNCPSCDVKPGKQHEQWCPRYLYQLNPYDASAYDDSLFLADYMETQIWFGAGHPSHPTKEKPANPGDYLLEKAGIKKANPHQKEIEQLPGAADELPF